MERLRNASKPVVEKTVGDNSGQPAANVRIVLLLLPLISIRIIMILMIMILIIRILIKIIIIIMMVRVRRKVWWQRAMRAESRS